MYLSIYLSIYLSLRHMDCIVTVKRHLKTELFVEVYCAS